MGKTGYLTVLAADMSGEARRVLTNGDYIADEVLREMEGVGRYVGDPEAYLEGHEGWYLDEDGNSVYVAPSSEVL